MISSHRKQPVSSLWMTQTGSVLVVAMIPLVGIYTWMQSRSKYNPLLFLYRWLAANTNLQGFKAHAQEDCGHLEGVATYRIQFFASIFHEPKQHTKCFLPFQFWPEISVLKRGSIPLCHVSDLYWTSNAPTNLQNNSRSFWFSTLFFLIFTGLAIITVDKDSTESPNDLLRLSMLSSLIQM